MHSNEGLVLSGRNGSYELETANGRPVCRSAAKIAKAGPKLCAGDRVIFTDNGDGTGFITSLLERRNHLVRPSVANVDLLCIVVSPCEPDPCIYNIDLLTLLAEKAGIEPMIIVTKNDISSSDEIVGIYRKTPYCVIVTSAEKGEGIESAREALKGKICVLCGASGVGKSSLLNAMYPFLNAETGCLSERISRGKNTTRVTKLFPLGESTYLADSPGFSSIETEQYFALSPSELFGLFPEFAQFTGKCRYSDCTHTKETECAVADAANSGLIAHTRLESYRRLYSELRSIDRYK